MEWNPLEYRNESGRNGINGRLQNTLDCSNKSICLTNKKKIVIKTLIKTRIWDHYKKQKTVTKCSFWTGWLTCWI